MPVHIQSNYKGSLGFSLSPPSTMITGAPFSHPFLVERIHQFLLHGVVLGQEEGEVSAVALLQTRREGRRGEQRQGVNRLDLWDATAVKVQCVVNLGRGELRLGEGGSSTFTESKTMQK